MPRASRHALGFILLTVLIDTIGFGIVLPVLPDLIRELRHAGLDDAARWGGLLAFAYAAMQFVCAPIMGSLSDPFGLVGAAFGTGFILGPAIGGYLGALGPRAPFFAASALAFANLVYGALLLPESLPPDRRRPFSFAIANPAGALALLRRHPGTAAFATALLCWMLGHQVLPNVWTYYTMRRFDWTERTVGLSLAAAGISMILVQGTLTRVAIPKLGERRSAAIGLASGAAGFLCYAFAPAGWVMFAGMAVSALSGLVYPAINGLLSQRTPADEQGALQGAVGSLYGLTEIVGPILMTQLFAIFSSPTAAIAFPGMPFAVAALLALAAFGIMLRK